MITGLEKGTYYEVRVVAFDGFNRAYSETKSVGTVGFGKFGVFIIILFLVCKKERLILGKCWHVFFRIVIWTLF